MYLDKMFYLLFSQWSWLSWTLVYIICSFKIPKLDPAWFAESCILTYMQGKNVMESRPEPPKKPTFTCPICMNTLVEASSTICGHIFCQSCIKASIQFQKKCPTCRRKLTMNNFHKVYLPTTDWGDCRIGFFSLLWSLRAFSKISSTILLTVSF